MVIDLNVSADELDDEENPNDFQSNDCSVSEEVSVSDLDNESYMSLRNQLEDKLQVGSVYDSLDVIYILYSQYGVVSGFSVKKGAQKKIDESKELKLKVFHCSCEGYPDNKRSVGRIASYKKQVTRTNCKARLRVVRPEEGDWTVSVFFKQHNHEFVSPDQSYTLRSARHMSYAKKSVLDALRSVGIKISKAYRFMEKEAGGRPALGFTKKDAYAHVNLSRKETKLENVDANALMKYFIGKGNTETHFYWNVQLDDDGRLMNFFFRDTRCAFDYELFGDVLSVDTTYRTNKYNLICAPFVGINHHKNNVLFGLAFLSDETTKSFEWLFSTFLEAMNGKEPGIIFSDQCQALMNGIDYTFKTACHRLCQWHINQNAPSHFGSLNGNAAFKQSWYYCMNGCATEDEFDSTWQTMITNYGLSENRWFRNMYNLRKRWSSVFTIDKFTAGLHATSRSEVTNKVLKDLCSATTTLHDFVLRYERLQHEWRLREIEEDTMCRGVPGQFIQNNNLLKHAASVYTRNVYKTFECEVAHSLNVKIIHHPYDFSGDELVYGVSSTSASNGMRSLPEHFILKRWRKDAKNRLQGDDVSKSPQGGIESIANMVFVNHNMRTLYDMMLECKGEKLFRDVISKHVGNCVKEIARLKSERQGPNSPNAREEKNSGPVNIKNPRTPKKKRYPVKRLRRHWDGPHPKRPVGKSNKRTCFDDDSIPNFELSQTENFQASQISGTREREAMEAKLMDLIIAESDAKGNPKGIPQSWDFLVSVQEKMNAQFYMSKDGVFWDKLTNTLRASEETWRRIQETKSGALVYRARGEPHYVALAKLFHEKVFEYLDYDEPEPSESDSD
ncbi:protein FAR1-RELATED SEQUENCE 5-like [Salvia miltiorrhiza]|uniref:protein FAR1-RELATED SEQUENCE 5-like n=1 Tax=Salvia miltiorrhiza TaxID=226208 RepID=UPI0025AD0F3D|nr:protein FAR1-RELATED SEQUENCE 5-like [Salvia miltiorrhiza]